MDYLFDRLLTAAVVFVGGCLLADTASKKTRKVKARIKVVKDEFKR